MTMNGELLQSLMNPLPQKKMAGLEGTIGSLATAEDLHRFPNSQLPQYSGTYFTCEPRLPDGDNLPPFWGPPNRSLLNGRNALIHSPREKGSPSNHIVYAADNLQFPTEANHASPAQDLPEKQGFSYYTKSPERRRIMTPGGGTTGPVRKHPVGSGNASPTSGNSICLAFPKPIYGHSPCCSELGCTARPRYRVEPGEQRVDPNVFEEDWVLYSHRALLHGSNPAFLHERPTQLEHSADRLPLRDVAADQFLNLSPNEKRTLPAFTESNYISYPCTPTRPLVAPSLEPCQRLQIPSKAFHGLYPSHAPTYKHMTSVHLASSSQLYQNPSPMSTYGQLTHQQLVYYPQANVEAQSGVAYKDAGGKYKADVNPSVHRTSPPNPLAHYLVSQPRFSDVPLITHMVPPPSHSFLRGYDHSSNPVYRMNLTSDQMRSTIDKLCAPPPAMQMGRFCAPPHRLHMDRPSPHSHSIQGDHARVPQPNLHMNRPCAPPHSQKVDQPIATSYRLLMDRPKPPPQSQHMDRSGVPATSPQPEQALDYSKYRGTSPRQAQDPPEGGRAMLTRQSSDGRGHPHHTSAGIYNTDAQTVTCSPAICSYGSPVPRSNADLKNLKRHPSDAHLNNPPTSLDDRKVTVEIGPPKKRVKMETEESRVSNCQFQASPPMPVINNVFSLAPYKTYIEAKQIFSSVQSSPKVEELQHYVVKAEPCDQEDDRHPGEIPVVSSSSAEVKPAVLLDSSKEEPAVKMIELTKIKSEPQDQILEEVKHEGSLPIPVKNEELEKDLPVSGLMLVIKKCDPDELESKSFKSANEVLSLENVADPPVEQEKVRPSIRSSPQWTVWPKPATPSPTSDGKSDLQKIPPQSLKLPAHKMILPERLKAAPLTPQAPEKLLPPAQTQVMQGAEDPRPARQHFMELHQALCRLLSKSVTQSPKQELRDWLSKLEHTGSSTPSAKAQNLSGLLGAEARELWLSNVEIRCSLQKVLQRLKEYISQDHCPFPHVKRAGAVFIPMLVLKEILFPQVQGVFINQVLQEHKVELRPTTLSEEKTLTQLHKRACSSKLRRLLSLKNLPEIYLDVLNLLYHTCVCKHMGVKPNGSARRGGGEASEEADIAGAWSCLQITASRASSPDAQEHREEMKRGLVVEKRNIKSRRRSSNSKHIFWKKRRLSRGEVESTKQAANGVIQTTSGKVWDGCPVGSSGDEESEHTEGEKYQSVMTSQEEEPEDSWKGPLTSDKLFSSPSDNATERTSTLFHGNQFSPSDNPQCARKSQSGMILKLRKVLYNKGRVAHYQAVSDPQPHYRPPLPEAREQGRTGDRGPRECDLPHRKHKSGRFSLDLGSTRSASKKVRLCRSLMNIKYCPYLSACHSAEHRRRWVLRSAVQRAQRAFKKYFPDLVGKRIRHLYEELDKTEVWYRGLVVRVHEAHPNPLKTVFEVQYDSEPEWTYYLELLIDFKKGWLKIED